MEVIPEGKHFKLVQDNELLDIMKILENYMPEAIKFHQTIKTYLNDRVWQFYFYVSKNWPADPICLHFPGCTLTPKQNIYGSFGIFCPTERIECVDLLETEDILIDWKESMYLNFTHIDIMNRLDAFYQHYGVMERLLGDIYTCHETQQLKKLEQELDSLPNEEVEMRPLIMDNVKAIHDLYPASEIECVQVFEKLIKQLPGFGIFTRNTGELAAWMMHSYYGAMFSMQTKPEFRRKGYGIHLAQALTRTVIDRGYTPFVVIRPENDASRNLYKKLGFQKAFETARVTLNPTVTNGHATTTNNDINLKNFNLDVNGVMNSISIIVDNLIINENIDPCPVINNDKNDIENDNNNNNNQNNNDNNTDLEIDDTQKDEGIEDIIKNDQNDLELKTNGGAQLIDQTEINQDEGIDDEDAIKND